MKFKHRLWTTLKNLNVQMHSSCTLHSLYRTRVWFGVFEWDLVYAPCVCHNAFPNKAIAVFTSAYSKRTSTSTSKFVTGLTSLWYGNLCGCLSVVVRDEYRTQESIPSRMNLKELNRVLSVASKIHVIYVLRWVEDSPNMLEAQHEAQRYCGQMTASFCHSLFIPLKRLINGVSPLVIVFLAPICSLSTMAAIVPRSGGESESVIQWNFTDVYLVEYGIRYVVAFFLVTDHWRWSIPKLCGYPSLLTYSLDTSRVYYSNFSYIAPSKFQYF